MEIKTHIERLHELIEHAEHIRDLKTIDGEFIRSEAGRKEFDAIVADYKKQIKIWEDIRHKK